MHNLERKRKRVKVLEHGNNVTIWQQCGRLTGTERKEARKSIRQ